MKRRTLLRVAAGVLGGGAATAAALTVTRDGVEASDYGAVGGSGSLAITTE